MTDKTCFANHMGIWAIEAQWMRQAVEAIRSGAWAPSIMNLHKNDDDDRRMFNVVGDGVAVIPMNGPMMKGFSKFGGVSTVQTRTLIREAVQDEDVRAILLHIDSPGGHVAGTGELAREVAQAGEHKPVAAHIDDLGASAAFWIASQTSRITANATAEVGSIGTLAVVEDTSKKFEMEGIAVHVISTGEQKGAFTDGSPVDKKHLANLQERVDDLNAHFLSAVKTGRQFSEMDMSKISDGRVMIASKALDVRLIDSIETLEDAVVAVGNLAPQGEKANSQSHKRMAAKIRLSESD